MAHFKRKRSRTKTGRRKTDQRRFKERREPYPDFAQYGWLGHWPRYWDIEHHTRPRRRREKRAEYLVMSGRDPDDVIWPLNKKPHVYYW